MTEESFLKDVSAHQMTVLNDTGLYRHLRFASVGSDGKPHWNQYFTLTTFPDHLVFSGDMGTYVFTRLQDMFEFFRGKPDGPLQINPDYWGGKCLAADKATGGDIMAYSSEKFKAVVTEIFNDHEFESATEKELCWLAIEDEVLCGEGEHEAYSLAGQFQFQGEHFFHDFWEHRLREYTGRYLWCCFAIVWGIRQYDAAKT